ncbi:glycosyltransferase family 4 protein [Candidatus Thioglobus sp.]|nr:glycosyltransferase family 4 protein [Candidatus Thioglobus sp.]
MNIFSNELLFDIAIELLILVSFFLCLFLIFLYKKLAIRFKILANPNFRSLHEDPIPNGGGIVFSFIFIICVLILMLLGEISEVNFMLFFYGAVVATSFGFLDDLMNISPKKKLIVQILLSGWTLYCIDGGLLFGFEQLPELVSILISMILLVWILNAYNFMDGVDGLAISGATFFSGLAAYILYLNNGNSELILLLLLLMSCSMSMMFFNWPPATIFMGDAGSIFLGYIFGVFIFLSIKSNDISIWTWLVILGYFFADTTMTQIMRVFLVKKWYKPHRSHAYQNLARIAKSHSKITISVTLYHIFWLIPLALWSVLKPEIAVIPAIMAITPGLFITYKYGPSLSSS